ncbi:MAG: hypothetical protein ACI8P3_001371 [Saprospiraceae bacterium]|jgi:hypothetical protein
MAKFVHWCFKYDTLFIRIKSGKLICSETLKLTCDLKEFPEEILSLAETLEVLDSSLDEPI